MKNSQGGVSRFGFSRSKADPITAQGVDPARPTAVSSSSLTRTGSFRSSARLIFPKSSTAPQQQQPEEKQQQLQKKQQPNEPAVGHLSSRFGFKAPWVGIGNSSKTAASSNSYPATATAVKAGGLARAAASASQLPAAGSTAASATAGRAVSSSRLVSPKPAVELPRSGRTVLGLRQSPTPGQIVESRSSPREGRRYSPRNSPRFERRGSPSPSQAQPASNPGSPKVGRFGLKRPSVLAPRPYRTADTRISCPIVASFPVFKGFRYSHKRPEEELLGEAGTAATKATTSTGPSFQSGGSQLPGIRASFFNRDYAQGLNSATIHNSQTKTELMGNTWRSTRPGELQRPMNGLQQYRSFLASKQATDNNNPQSNTPVPTATTSSQSSDQSVPKAKKQSNETLPQMSTASHQQQVHVGGVPIPTVPNASSSQPAEAVPTDRCVPKVTQPRAFSHGLRAPPSEPNPVAKPPRSFVDLRAAQKVSAGSSDAAHVLARIAGSSVEKAAAVTGGQLRPGTERKWVKKLPAPLAKTAGLAAVTSTSVSRNKEELTAEELEEEEDMVVRPKPSAAECLEQLKFSTKSILDQHRKGIRPNQKTSRVGALPAIPQEESYHEEIGPSGGGEAADSCPEAGGSCAELGNSPHGTESGESGIFCCSTTTSGHSLIASQEFGEENAAGGQSDAKAKKEQKNRENCWRAGSAPPPRVFYEATVHLSQSLPLNFGRTSALDDFRSKMAAFRDPMASGLIRSTNTFSDLDEVGSSRETSPVSLLEELCCRRDERAAISPGTVSTTRRKFEQKSSPTTDVESDKFARERSSTEKLRAILRSESELASVALLMTDCQQQLLSEDGAADAHATRNKGSGYQPSCSLTSSLTEGSQSLVSDSQQAKATPSPSSLSDTDHNKMDFLIDDDYKDQPELTFCCHQDEEEGHSIEESIFETVDSLLSRHRELEEEQQKEEQEAARTRFSPIHNHQIEKLKQEAAARRNSAYEETALEPEPASQAARKSAKSRKRSRQISQTSLDLDTLSGHDLESLASDDCILDYDSRLEDEQEGEEDGEEDRKRSLSPHVLEADRTRYERALSANQPSDYHRSISRSSSITSDEGIILDRSTHNSVTKDVLEVKTLLLQLRRLLQETDGGGGEEDLVSPHDSGNYLPGDSCERRRPSDLQLPDSLTAAWPPHTKPLDSESELRSLRAENDDLKRMVMSLQLQLEDKNRRMLTLESHAVSSSTRRPVSLRNAASQTERARPISCGTISSIHEDGLISPVSDLSKPPTPTRPPTQTRRERDRSRRHPSQPPPDTGRRHPSQPPDAWTLHYSRSPSGGRHTARRAESPRHRFCYRNVPLASTSALHHRSHHNLLSNSIAAINTTNNNNIVRHNWLTSILAESHKRFSNESGSESSSGSSFSSNKMFRAVSVGKLNTGHQKIFSARDGKLCISLHTK